MSLTDDQLYRWKIALELKLRKCHGDAFQEFFSDVMAKAYGDDFVRVRPFGALGDSGCDGYLQSNGQVFACYGAVNGESDKVASLVKKMESDYDKAVKAIPQIMKEWRFVHNLVEGLPIQAVTKLEELRQKDAQRKFGFIGMEKISELVASLDPAKIEELLGPAATALDTQNLQAPELRDLVGHVMEAVESTPFDPSIICPVSPEKLNFNGLPNHWRALIAGGWQNAHHVETYINRHTNPLVGVKVAQSFGTRYRYLRYQALPSGKIMSDLYEMVVGVGTVQPSRQVAAQALLAFLFESCDIFENPPAEVV